MSKKKTKNQDDKSKLTKTNLIVLVVGVSMIIAGVYLWFDLIMEDAYPKQLTEDEIRILKIKPGQNVMKVDENCYFERDPPNPLSIKEIRERSLNYYYEYGGNQLYCFTKEHIEYDQAKKLIDEHFGIFQHEPIIVKDTPILGE